MRSSRLHRRLSTDGEARGAREDDAMTDAAMSRLKDAENSERFRLRKAEARMAAGIPELGRELGEFADDLEETEVALEAELRKEHWGHTPTRPESWRAGRDA
jgi:hypothetical protein